MFLTNFKSSIFQKGKMATFSETILTIGQFCIESGWFECQMTSKIAKNESTNKFIEKLSIFLRIDPKCMQLKRQKKIV